MGYQIAPPCRILSLLLAVALEITKQLLLGWAVTRQCPQESPNWESWYQCLLAKPAAEVKRLFSLASVEKPLEVHTTSALESSCEL